MGLEDANPSPTPVDSHVKLMPMKSGSEPEIECGQYQNTIGSLMYAALGMRPDISFLVQHLSQISSYPSNAHWTAIKQVFCYLK